MPDFNFQHPDPSKRLDALEAFIKHWVGPRQPAYGATPEQIDHLELPTALRRLYQFCANWPREHSLPNGIPLLSVQNYLLPPDNSPLSPEEKLANDYFKTPPSLIQIGSENQGVTAWATEKEGDDPPVYGHYYEEGAFYQSPDGEIHEQWRRLDITLTDFLIGFVLYELYAGSWIWPLTPLIEQLKAAPEQMTPLVTSVFGNPHKISLYDDDVLVMQRPPQWNEPDPWEFAVRNDDALAKIGRFSGTLSTVSFQLTDDVAGYDKPRLWAIRFIRDKAGTLSSSRTPGWLSRDSFPAGVALVENIVAQIEGEASDIQSEARPIKVAILRERAAWGKGGSRGVVTYCVSKSIAGALFQLGLEAIENPSLALLEQLEIGSPFE